MKFATLNVERSKHLARVEHFIRTQKPDAICLQEVLPEDLDFFADLFGGHENITWAPITKGVWPESPDEKIIGMAIASPHGLKNISASYYHGTDDPLPTHRYDHQGVVHDSVSHAVLFASVKVNGESFRLGCVHHTWTMDGQSTDFQITDTHAMLEVVKADNAEEGDIILAGDFNAPRGRATWGLIASAYTDNIPENISSSLDPKLHRAGHLPRMVDGIFTTPGYVAKDVTQHFMVSDHTGFTATIIKR